jgi:hypothetical protein
MAQADGANADPFHDLPTAADGQYVLYEQTKVPLRNRDDHTIIHDTANVDYVLKNIGFQRQGKFLLDDFQFSLSARASQNNLNAEDLEAYRSQDKFTQQEIENNTRKGKKHIRPENEAAKDHHNELDNSQAEQLEQPLMEDCLSGIDQSIVNVLTKMRSHYDVQHADDETRERCYITVTHSSLRYGIKAGNFNLHKENLAQIADTVTTKINNFVNSGNTVRLNVPLDDSFSVRFVVSAAPLCSAVLFNLTKMLSHFTAFRLWARRTSRTGKLGQLEPTPNTNQNATTNMTTWLEAALAPRSAKAPLTGDSRPQWDIGRRKMPSKTNVFWWPPFWETCGTSSMNNRMASFRKMQRL